MRIGSVIGRVTLSQAVPSLVGARWLIVSPFTRRHFAGEGDPAASLSREPSPVVYDHLGGGLGNIVGFIEGREAAVPFEVPTPVDAFNAAIVDDLFYAPYP
jgi:ethanolamine utilization protein EutN